ncbi:unnamed protein product [Camellia sinensis]
MRKTCMHVGVAGLGGLGHMVVKFAKAFGVKVTVISTSPSKKKEATEHLKADSFLVSRDIDQMEGIRDWRMKGFINNGDFIKSSRFLKISGLIFISLVFFYLGKHWSDGSHQLIFFNSRQTPLSSSKTPSTVSLSHNLNKTFDINCLINNTTQTQPLSNPTLPLIPPTSHPKPLPPPPHERFRIVDENRTIADDFEVGDFDPGVVDNWGNDIEAEVVEEGCGGSRVVVKKFGLCTDSMREYIPCLDNIEAIQRFNLTEKGERFEQHCPQEGNDLNCLVPAPKGYRASIPWPKSRDMAFGVKVTVISTSPSKKKEATKHLEADSFLVSRDVDQMEDWRMKSFINNGDFIKSSTFLKISGLIFISLAFFCLAKHWSDGSHQLIFFNSRQTPLSSSKTPSPISFSSNLNKTFDINSLTNNTTQTQPLSDPTLSSIPPTSHPKPLPPPPHERFGIVDENGTMVDGFEVRDFDSGVVDNWGSDIEAEVMEDGCGGSRVVVKKFGLFMDSMREYILCLDNTEAIRHFNSKEKGERFERHCPEEGKGLNCLVPAPKGYGAPIPWPRSHDEIDGRKKNRRKKPTEVLWTRQTCMHVGVAGLGGLGHMAVKFAKAFGVKVTVISTSPSKKKEAAEHLEANSFLVSCDIDQMEAAIGTIDGIIDTVSAIHHLLPLLNLLKSHGQLIMVGAPEKPLELLVFPLLMERQ